MLTISGVVTGAGSFQRRNGQTQKTVEIEGLQINLPDSISHPSVGQHCQLSVVVRQFDGGRLGFTAVPVASSSR